MRGSEIVQQLGGRDLNDDGVVINLAIVGSSRFYDFSAIEDRIDDWVEENGWPDLILLGGASGVDYWPSVGLITTIFLSRFFMKNGRTHAAD